MRAASLRRSGQCSAGNLGRLCAEEVVLLGAAAALTGVVLDAVLQRSPFAARGACGGHPKTRRCARPARWSAGRLRRMAELLTRGSVIVGRRCAQPRPGPPGVRAERLAPGRGASPRLPAGHATARTALPGTPGALDVPPRGRPDTNAGLCAAVRARAPRLSRRIPARRCRRTAGGTPGRESSGVRVGGRARFRSLRRSVRRVVSLDGLRLRITDPRVSKCRLAVVGEGCLRPLVNYRPAGQ